MMAKVFRGLWRYIVPFYTVGANDQARRQRRVLGEVPNKAGETDPADGSSLETAETTNKKVDAMQKQLKKTIDTVAEMDRHVLRCRRDVDGLFVTWSENITDEYSQEFDKKAVEFDKRVKEYDDKMRRFDQILERKCEQAGHTASLYMEEVVGKHNAKVQQDNEQLREQLARLEKKVDEKLDSAEGAILATEQSALENRLVQFQQKQKDLYDMRAKDLVQIMLKQRNLSTWVHGVEKEHSAIVLRCEADVENRRVLDRHLRVLEQHPRPFLVSDQTSTVSSSQPSAPLSAETGRVLQHEATMAEVLKKLEDYESRLNKVEGATKHPSPCQSCNRAVRKVEKDLKDVKEALEKEELESRKKLEEYKNTANARYQVMEERFDNLAGMVRELPSLPVYWQIVARLEELELDKRWNDRVRLLESFGAATPEPVLKHMEYLESRLDIVLYDRGFPLPNSVARARIAWAWEALEHSLRAESPDCGDDTATACGHQAVQAHVSPLDQEQNQLTQQPHHTLEASFQRFPQGDTIEEATGQVEATSQPMCTDESVPLGAASETNQQETAQIEASRHVGSPECRRSQDAVQVPTTIEARPEQMMQMASQPPAIHSFGINMMSSFQAPAVDVPTIDWSASVSVNLSRNASDFDIDEDSRAKGPRVKPFATAVAKDIHNEGPIAAYPSNSRVLNDSMVTNPHSCSKFKVSTQVANASQQSQETLVEDCKTTDLDAPRKADIQSPFSVIHRKGNGDGQSNVPSLEQQKHPTSQTLYEADASSAYTTVCNPKTATPAMVNSSNMGLYTITASPRLPPLSCTSSGFATYDPTKPSPTNPNSHPKAMHGPSVALKQQALRGLTSSGLVNYTPAQPPRMNPGIRASQAASTPAAEPQVQYEPKTRGNLSDGDDEGSEPDVQLSTVPTTRENTSARHVMQKPKGRLNRMTDAQRNAIRRELESQKAGVSSMTELPPIIPQPLKPRLPAEAPLEETGARSVRGKEALPSETASTSTTLYDREDAVDYGDTDDENPGPAKPSANIAPTPTDPAREMRRYSTQWLKIWRSHVVSEQNMNKFAEINGFEDSTDKWIATVENANANTKHQDVLSQANIAVHRQLYSWDDINKIADAFFEICLVQSGSFQLVIENFDPFRMTDYHMSFLDAFEEYLKDHPADSY